MGSVPFDLPLICFHQGEGTVGGGGCSSLLAGAWSGFDTAVRTAFLTRLSGLSPSSSFEMDPVDLREIRLAANGGFALGNGRFKAEIAEALGRRVERLRDRDSPQFPS